MEPSVPRFGSAETQDDKQAMSKLGGDFHSNNGKSRGECAGRSRIASCVLEPNDLVLTDKPSDSHNALVASDSFGFISGGRRCRQGQSSSHSSELISRVTSVKLIAASSPAGKLGVAGKDAPRHRHTHASLNCYGAIPKTNRHVNASRVPQIEAASADELTADRKNMSEDTASVKKHGTSQNAADVPCRGVLADCTLFRTPEGSYIEACKLGRGSLVQAANGDTLSVSSVKASATRKVIKLCAGDITLLVTRTHLVCVCADDDSVSSDSTQVKQAKELLCLYKNKVQLRAWCSDGSRILTGAEELLLPREVRVLDIRFNQDLPIAAVYARSITKEAIHSKGHKAGCRRGKKGKNCPRVETKTMTTIRKTWDDRSDGLEAEKSSGGMVDDCSDETEIATTVTYPRSRCGDDDDDEDDEAGGNDDAVVIIKNTFVDFAQREHAPSRSQSTPPRHF
eukprot:TRINITY_DN29881_c0_g1_i1.p1 TRINITY_DN29881_c0_g1~~TRINITY_DN29881_c0_g1_i1.p1  ORF type:complete len:476 (-),score=58.87 TRINITY_DN29881_c0_g1_i1:101-1459(-)